MVYLDITVEEKAKALATMENENDSNNRKGNPYRHGCLLLIGQYPSFFPVDGTECKAGNAAALRVCKKEQEDN